MPLDIILRTCDHTNAHAGKRFVDAPKREIILRCVASLVEAITAIPASADVHMSLTVLDDHSSAETLDVLRDLFSRLSCPWELRALVGTGVNRSLKESLDCGLAARGLVYFVEDDYLHYPEALAEMLTAYTLFKRQLGGATEVGIFPCDYPDEYRRMEPCRIVPGPARPWRTSTHTTSTLLLHSDLVRNFCPLFEALSHYGLDPASVIAEDDTTNRIWREGGAMLFTPLPSLAFHLQDEPPLFEDWQALWDASNWRN